MAASSDTSTISLSDDGAKYLTAGGVGGFFSGTISHYLRLAGPSGFGGFSTSTEVVTNWNGAGKVVIVTGAAGGLGFETARALAARGAEVVVTARDRTKADSAVERLRQLLPADAKLTALPLDVSDQASIKAFVAAFVATHKPLHILINNAGVMYPKYTTTKDGFEAQLGTNHLGHFTLTNLLMPHLIETAKKSGSEGRVVCVASLMHHSPYKEGVRLQGHDDASRYNVWGAYGQAKLANVLFARELAVRLAKQGAPVTVYSLHPGCIPTDLNRDMHPAARAGFRLLCRPLLKSIPQGAATQLWAATVPPGSAPPSGEYLQDCNVAKASVLAHDAALGKGLWELSEKLTGVRGAV